MTGGKKAVAEIDAAIAAERVACGEHGIGGLEMPPDGADVTSTSKATG